MRITGTVGTRQYLGTKFLPDGRAQIIGLRLFLLGAESLAAAGLAAAQADQKDGQQSQAQQNDGHYYVGDVRVTNTG